VLHFVYSTGPNMTDTELYVGHDIRTVVKSTVPTAVSTISLLLRPSYFLQLSIAAE